MKNYWLERKSEKDKSLEIPKYGMSELQYNGINIAMISTQAFEQDAVYDDLANSDYLYTKMRLRVQGVINVSQQPALMGETPAQTLSRIRKCLLAPRELLIFSAGDINDATQRLIYSPAPGLTVDSNNGPKPISVALTQITTVTFIVVYEIETYISEVCKGNKLPYLSNRWRETHEIDQQGYTTRTIEGQVTFTTDMVDSKSNPGNTAAKSADEYRNMIVPPNLKLLNGFIREKQKFTVTEDGRQLRYTVVDKQQYAFMSPVITKFEGIRTVKWSGGGGKWDEHITMRAWAPPTVPKGTVMQIVIAAAASCLNNNLIVQSGSVVDHLEENYVEVNLQTFVGKKATEKKTGVFFGHVPYADSGQPETLLNGIGGNTRTALPPPNVGLRGTYGLHMLVLAKYLGMGSNQSSEETIPGLQ